MSSVAARVFHLFIAFSCLFIASTVGTSSMDDTLSLCYPVVECNEGTDTNVNRLNYELSTDSWDSNTNMICPRSDSDVSQWIVLFKNSSDPQLYAKLTSGSYCLRNITTNDNSSTPLEDQLSPTVICTKNGELIIQNVPNYDDTSGQMEFTFNSSAEYSYETKFTIRYAPTGVYPEFSIVYFSEGEPFAALNWFIYHANPPSVNTFKVYFNNRLIKDESTNYDKTKYSYSPVTKCISTSTGVQTLHYSLFVINPSVTLSTGEYVLVVDKYSATITLALNPSPHVVTTTTTAPIPSSLHSSSVLSSLILSSPAIGSEHPPGPCPFSTASSITSSTGSSTSTSTVNRLYPSSSPPMVVRTDPTSRSSSSFDTDTIIILPVTVVVLVLLAVGAVLFCVVAFIVKRRNNKTANGSIENAQRSEEAGVGGEGSSSVAFTPSSGDPTPININRQYSEDPSLYKYHLRRGSRSDRKPSHETIGLENFTLTNDQSLRPTATTTTSSFNGPFSRSLSKSSNLSYQTIKPVSDDEARALKSATSIARTDSSESLEHEGHSYADKDHIESSYVNASRSSSFASNELIHNDQQPTGTPLQHKRLAELKGGATVVSQSLPATSQSLTAAASTHNDTTPQIPLMSSSVSSLEQEHTHLLRQLLNQAKRKAKIDKQVAMETDRTSREQLAIKKEMVNILQRREGGEGEGGVTDGHIGFYNQMSEVDDNDAMFEMDQDD